MPLFGRKKDDEPVTEGATDVAVEESPAPPAPTRRSLQEHRAFLLDKVGAMRPFGMQIWDVPGLTLCEDIVSDLDLPLVTTAKVAGFGVRASDCVGATPERPRSLYLVGSILSDDEPGTPLAAGSVVEVVEGAILPEGVDAVVPRSGGTVEENYVHITEEVRLHENLRIAGSELADGTPLLKAGDVLTPRSVAVLAEVGLDKVLVRPHPRVVVLTVGKSLVAPGQALTRPQQRYDSATALVTAAGRADGATVYPLGIVENSADAVRRALHEQQIRADLLVLVGGADLLRDADLGEWDEAIVSVNGESRYAFVALGKERTPLIVLPSGTVSAYIGYQAFVRPVINKLNDVERAGVQRVEGVLAVDLPGEEGTTQIVPGWRDGDGRVRPVSAGTSELAWDLARANVLMVVPEDWGGAQAGSRVECIVLDDARGQPHVPGQ